jgi:3-oxoacyl-[acyl-carrier protein] reductase
VKLNECIALVTGGGSGIGLETARLLKEQGAQVAICGRTKNRIERAGQTIGALPLIGDVGKEEDAARMVDTVIRTFGDYNTLINNAGFGMFAPLLELELDDFEAVLQTNVLGAMLMARESARHFVAKRRGNIVNVSSTAGSRGFSGGTAYVASKFALGGMTECWRAELRKHEVRVMQINPSEVLTDFGKSAGYTQKQSEKKLRGIEIAHAILAMLAMDDRGFTTELTVFATNPD